MANDELERLNKLAELRDRGVLSEAEFQSAKARLLGGGAARGGRSSGSVGPERSILREYSLAFIGLGVLLLLVIGVIVYGSVKADEEAENLTSIDIGNLTDSNVLDAVPDGEALCASQSAFVRIKDMIFERAVRQGGGDPARLDSLRRSIGVRMQYPVLRGYRQDIGRTECGGRLILDLPPTVRAAFDGVPSLEADVEYAFQGTDDAVVEIQGADFVVQQLATAAGMAGEGSNLAPGARTYNPSFDCGGKLSNVERMICQDEELARLDRGLAARYAELRSQVAPADWQSVADTQRAFLQRRSACADTACVREAYQAQARYFSQFEIEGE